MHDPYEIHPRDYQTAKQKAQMFIAADGICCVCGFKIDSVHDAWDEHINPLWLNGDNSAPNRGPAHEKCALLKTAAEAGLRAKVRSTAEKHMGAKARRVRPMLGTKASGYKKLFDGTTIKR